MSQKNGSDATLTIKQQQFADEYVKTGNARTAYMAAYKCGERVADVNSSRLLSNAKVQKYIEDLNNALRSPKIADMTEVKEFWTHTLRNEEAEPKDRLKASEYIAKTNAAFVEKVDGNIKGEMNIVIDGSVKDWAK